MGSLNYSSRKYVDLHVVDAIDQVALDLGELDAKMLSEALNDTPVNIVPHIARTAQALQSAVTNIINHRRSYCAPRYAIPYVHISCHGSQDGLLLTDREHIPWRTLSEILLPLQAKTDYNVPLSISACEGFYGWKLAWGISPKYEKRRPYYSLVGPKNKEDIVPLCGAFALFYRYLLVDFIKLERAVELSNRGQSVQLDCTYGSEIVYPDR